MLLSLQMTAVIKCDCIMRDVCNTNGFVDQNCPYDGPGLPLNDIETEEILLTLCPDFFNDRKYDLFRNFNMK